MADWEAGGLYLWKYVPAARIRGPFWCFSASLARLFPVIEINKEFSDFFDDPNRTRLTARESLAFNVIGISGWVLGAILIAAISGLTQKPSCSQIAEPLTHPASPRSQTPRAPGCTRTAPPPWCP